MRIPSLLAPPIPAKKLKGTLMTRAHGQLITRNKRARYIHTCHSIAIPSANLLISGGKIASANAL